MGNMLKHLTDWHNVLRLASVQYIALTDESQNTTNDGSRDRWKRNQKENTVTRCWINKYIIGEPKKFHLPLRRIVNALVVVTIHHNYNKSKKCD